MNLDQSLDYPMTDKRVRNRNHLLTDYGTGRSLPNSCLKKQNDDSRLETYRTEANDQA